MMDLEILILSIFLIFLVKFSESTQEKNESESLSDSSNIRKGRVSGRIVKLYSGTKPEPIFCPNEGYQPDPINCAVFYRCVKASHGKYTVFRFQCGPGTVYDPDTEVCNHPKSTKRSECGGESIPSYEQNHERENEIEEIQELPSPISTYKPPYTVQSTFNNTTKSTNFWVTSTVQQSPNIPVSNTDTWTTINQPTFKPLNFLTTSITQQLSTQSEDTCTSDGFMGDSENCRKFYRCVSNGLGVYIRYEFSCSESTIWDDESQSCNHPWAVKRRRCGRGNLRDDTTTTELSLKIDVKSNTTYQHHAKVSYGSKITQILNHTNKESSIPNKEKVDYGNRIKQKEFSSITHDQNHVSSASLDTQLQPHINHDNKNVYTHPRTDSETQSSQRNHEIYDLTKTTSVFQNYQKEYSQPYLEMKNNCSESGFMGDQNDCKKFYRCVDNGMGSYIRYNFSCGEGTVWDPELEACNHEWAVKDCKLNNIPIEIGHQNISATTTISYYLTEESMLPSDEEYIPYENHIQQYQTPVNDNDKQLMMTTENLKPTAGIVCKSNGLIGDKDNCKKFYKCIENGGGSFTKYEYNCGEGTVWDQNIEACNHAWAVKHCAGDFKNDTTSKQTTVMTTISLIQVTTEKQYHDDYDTGYGEHIVSSTISTSTTTKTKHLTDQKSKCTSSGFIGDEKDCTKFYRCVDDGNGAYILYQFSCGEHTVWDPEIEACNHKWAVKNCGGVTIDDYNKVQSSSPVNDEVITNDYFMNNEITESPKYNTTFTSTLTSTVLSTTSIENNKCIISGFMGDKNDCKKFYRCVDDSNGAFIRYDFSCGEGTVWDPSLESCIHAGFVKECGVYTNQSFSINESTTQFAPTFSTGLENYDQGYNVQPTTETNKSTMGSINETSNDICVKEGFIGDSKDCKKFYRCLDNQNGGFIKYEFSCGDGTIWDSEIDSCNHERFVKTPCTNYVISTENIDLNQSTTNLMIESTTKHNIEHDEFQQTSSPKYPDQKECISEGFVGDDSDCKIFYRCVDNNQGGLIRYQFSCGEGTVWDQNIQACNHPKPGQRCGNSEGDYFHKPPNHENDESKEELSTKKATTSIEDREITTMSENSSLCKSEGFYGNPNDCSKFYRCVDNGEGNFIKYDFTCGEGTIWDQEIQTCNYGSNNHQCSKKIDESNISTTENISEGSTTKKEQEATEKPGSSTPTGNDQCSTEGFFANSNECKKFYRCVDNGNNGYTKHEFTCGEGTVWVQDLQACDHDNGMSSCNTQNESIHTTKDASESTFTTESSQSQSSNKEADEYPTETSSQATSSVKKECTSEGFYPNENDCKRFYRCVDNGRGGYTRYDFTCGEGTAWDANIQACNHINEVQNCQNIHEDSQIKPVVEDEEVTDTTENKGTSSTSSSAIESSKPENQDKCKEEGYFGNTRDCKKFYRCVDNSNGDFTKYDYTCGDGTIWDQDITACNHPQDVTNPACKQDGSSTAPSTDSTSTSSSSQSTSSTTESSSKGSSNCSQEDSSKKPANKNITCTKAGYFADPNDCKKFYRCVDWDGNGQRFSVFHFDCGDGTIWDPQLETCNYEESVQPPRDCSGTQSQSENVQESSTTEESTTENGENITLQETTTTEQTTARETTTTEQTTTQQSTTNDQTTSQPPSTTEQTSTQQSTTSEDTTTQQTSTNEQTTTQQSTTNEQTTSQETTTEQITTSQSTTSEETTTQTSNTNEDTTTQESNSSEQTTTQQSSTTTHQSTTDEQTTTQESSSSEQSTDSTTTTEQTTSQESTTTEQTTSITEEPTTSTGQTTQQSTTEQSSTEGSTEESTTEQATEGQTSTTEEPMSTTTQQNDETTTTEKDKETSTTESTSSEKECPETDEDQNIYVCPTSFRQHPKYCNLFYQCTEDDDSHELKIAIFNCPNNTIYDESKTQCVEEEKANKRCEGEIAQRRRFKRVNVNYREPIVVSRDQYTCPSTGHFPFENNVECSPAFLKCQKSKSGKLRGFVYQCPDGYVYWSISRKCEPSHIVKDCKRSNNNWNGRWNIPIEKQNLAPPM